LDKVLYFLIAILRFGLGRKPAISLIDVLTVDAAPRKVIRIDKRLKYFIFQKHIRYLIPVCFLVAVEWFLKLIENDMGVEVIQFQIGQFLKLVFQGLVTENALLNWNQKNIACGKDIPDNVVVGRGSVDNTKIVGLSLQCPFEPLETIGTPKLIEPDITANQV
jgi:hypothetical protein